MEKANDILKLGQSVVILVNNSHYEEVGKVVEISFYNPYHVKVQFDDGSVQGYMTNEIKPLIRMGQPLMFDNHEFRKWSRFLRKVLGV